MNFWRKILTLEGMIILLAGNVVFTVNAAGVLQQGPVCIQQAFSAK